MSQFNTCNYTLNMIQNLFCSCITRDNLIHGMLIANSNSDSVLGVESGVAKSMPWHWRLPQCTILHTVTTGPAQLSDSANHVKMIPRQVITKYHLKYHQIMMEMTLCTTRHNTLLSLVLNPSPYGYYYQVISACFVLAYQWLSGWCNYWMRKDSKSSS